MFTGIIEGIGIVLAKNFFSEQMRLRIKPPFSGKDLKIGDSIAVNGACLTVEKFTQDWFEAYASRETLQLTNLKNLVVNSSVNLERALIVGDRLGGHFVSGHVDTVAKVQTIRPAGNSQIIRLKFAQEFSKFLISKGSVALDGISLTINQCGTDFLEVNIIPKTLAVTNIANWQVGYGVNMETDLIGKYILKTKETSNLSLDFLQQHGF